VGDVRPPPGPYAAWASWLTAYGRGEDLPTTHLVPIGDDMGPDMQARVMQRLNEAFIARQQLWVKAFDRDRDAFDLTRLRLATNLVEARTRLRPLVDLCRNELLPEPVRAVFAEALGEAVRSTQNSLEDSVRRLPQGADELLTVIRDNALTVALTAPSRVDEAEQRPAGRSIIL
jgi:hypothetical protein